MFDDFDYKKGAKGAGGLLKGVVKAKRPCMAANIWAWNAPPSW